MKKFNELETQEQKEITSLFANWLERYTQEVILKVLAKRDEIINNEFVMQLLKELREREIKERVDFQHGIEWLLMDYDNFTEYDVHNHPLTHANSYRDVLYDMYIK